MNLREIYIFQKNYSNFDLNKIDKTIDFPIVNLKEKKTFDILKINKN